MDPQIAALSDGAATGLIIAAGAGGSFALVLALTLLTVRRTERKVARRERKMAAVGAGNGRDTYPPQPYSPQEPHSHRPFSRPYQIPRQESAHGEATNGSRPTGSNGTELPMAPWPPPKGDEE
ncbi:MAG TPA: hypothetical protein VGZ32_22640 [Actinocrinis sp.]|jgi:hypothetical protein|uniref:hypothetical protein n=1 Tax=Actinocrinis sp. TaxID=1920516 RepID=UPI002DDD17CB|nr:hypothetical protein [Actinocrinis sp.]HEV3173163.1 hypothetical protein [Actinocrinis sp.]